MSVSRISELLAQIDKANAEHSPSRRADYADALVDELRDIFPDDRLSEIAKAERDGRLVVLPCKVGDTLYYPYAKRVIEKRVTQYRELLRKSECIDKWLCVDFSNDETFEADDIGKTIFLTRAEAEAALKGDSHE